TTPDASVIPSLTLGLSSKSMPFTSTVPPPAQMVIGVTPLIFGGGLTVMVTISVDLQPAGAGFEIVTVYLPGGRSPFLTMMVIEVQIWTPIITSLATSLQPPIIVGV